MTKFVAPIQVAFVHHRRAAEDDHGEGILWQASHAVVKTDGQRGIAPHAFCAHRVSERT
ncbi:hypothetical protein [Amycolatopsis sp. NPDC050768]|uniref:hypothetical protein n=1 Tax=Amycolatopsis sp. NPDC050768 TaxID=3154839 RepID=UPI0033D11FAA